MPLITVFIVQRNELWAHEVCLCEHEFQGHDDDLKCLNCNCKTFFPVTEKEREQLL